jgi:hypothetical protein
MSSHRRLSDAGRCLYFSSLPQCLSIILLFFSFSHSLGVCFGFAEEKTPNEHKINGLKQNKKI